MAIPASALSLSSLRIKFLESQPYQLHNRFLIHAPTHSIAAPCSVKLPIMAQFRDPAKVKLHMNYFKEKLWDVIPDSVKEFPWKKAEVMALRHFLVCVQEATKWSLITFFVFSFVSDIVYSISRNKELLIPFGLFVGCMITNFLNDTSQELFPNSEELGLNRQLLGIGCFFVVVKILSAYVTVGGRVFLLHAANGGLMQILWLWKSFPQEQDTDNRDDSLLVGSSTAANAAD